MIRTSKRSERLKDISALVFREIVKREASKKSPDFNSWFDLWHRHVDWEGDGSLSRQHRRFELWALFRMLHRFERETQHIRDHCQVFAQIHESDPGSDAVYVHTPNPNRTPFPYTPDPDTWLKTAPAWLAGHVNLERYNLGVTTSDGERYYFVQRKL